MEQQEIKQEVKQEVKQLDNLFTALSQFQGAIKSVRKGAENPFFNSKYADLAMLWDDIRAPLSKAGLSVTQLVGEDDITTILGHTSGQYLETATKMRLTKTDPQSVGSVITYYRRYALSAILGLSAEDEDDDAESAMDRKTKTPRARTPKKAEVKAPVKPEYTKEELYCKEHKTYWFKKGKMTSYAHPVKDEAGKTVDWCYKRTESKTTPVKEEVRAIPQIKTIPELMQVAYKELGLQPADVLKKLGVTSSGMIVDTPEECYKILLEK